MTLAADGAPAVGGWTTARVVEKTLEGEALVRLRLEVADPFVHLPGQHCVLRLRAPDDYTAQRSYSIASAPADPLVELMVERLPDGEVSEFLHEEARVGDVLEVRGAIGGWFTWTGEPTAICVAGGTGVVPIISMLRHATRLGLLDRLRVVAVGRTWGELPYADELQAAGAVVALTRQDLGSRYAGPPELDEVRSLVEDAERAYVCGSVGFASFATRLLGEAGVRVDTIRVEQFGATG